MDNNQRRLRKKLKSEQRDRHENHRLALLKELGGLLPPALTSNSVAAIATKLESLNETEERENTIYFEKLNHQVIEMMEDAAQLREDLRKELHQYGALAVEPDLFEHQ